MRQTAFITLLLVFMLTFQTACSSEEKAAAKTWDDPYLDSLAGVTHEIRSDDNKLVTLETNFGKMTLELYRDVAPAHADSFVARTTDGFYDGVIFHRVIDNFMIQGGDPTGTGGGDAGYRINAEFNDLPHIEGTLSMARANDPNSASCQFFICLARNRTTEYLDGKYTVFGHLIKGYDVLHAIGKVPVGPSAGGERSKPQKEVKIIKAYVSDAEGNPIESKKG